MRSKFLTLLCLTVLLSGCATQAPTLNFTPNDVLPAKNKVQAELKSLTVSIAKEEERIGETQVGFFGNQYEATFKQSLKDALEEAITKSAIFNDLANKKVSLTAKVMQFETPSAGINFDTKAVIRYEIFDRSNGQLIFIRDISSSGNVPFDYAFMGAIRYTEARNRAMRDNVTQFINSLEELKVATE
jgi:hypothetical protein